MMLASRLPLSTGWGLLLSLTTFWLLWITISMPLNVGPRTVAKPIDYTPAIEDTKPVPKPVREKPVWQPPQAIGPADRIDIPRNPPARTKPDARPHIDTVPPPGPITGGDGSDHAAVQWIQIQPTYPPAAERRGMEGWVLVQFSVTATGSVTDVVVVDADPPGVFDRETIEAVQRWRFRPRVENGMPVESVGMQTLISFEME